MKKMIAIFLALTCIAALIPAGAQVDAAAVTKEPFYVLNVLPIYWEEGDLTLDMPYFADSYYNGSTKPATISWRNISSIKGLAQELKDEFDYRPEGTRYVFLNTPGNILHKGMADEYVYFDKPTQYVKDWMEMFLAEYSRIGGKLDGFVTDVEYWLGAAYEIWSLGYQKGDTTLYWDIVNHPQYKTVLRPKLEKAGFEFWPESKQDSKKSEIYSMCPEVGMNSISYHAWNNVLDELLTEYLNECVLEPMLKYYPNALFNDYGRADRYGWQKQWYGSMIVLPGNSVKAGNVSNATCYPGSAPWDNAIGKYNTPDSFNEAKYEATPFNTALWKVVEGKNMLAAEPNNMFSAWITFYNFRPTALGSFANTPYYSELMYHLGMLDPQPFLGYILDDEIASFGAENSDPDASNPEVVWNVVKELMAELTRVAGYSDRKPIQTPGNWNYEFMLSGMYANGRNIWRISPDTSTGTTVASFKVKDNDPTFSINGQTVTFPQGKIITDSKISKVGTCGYWVETPANVMPVITGTSDRYEKDPSFAETFEGFANGAAFTEDVTDAWKVSGGAVSVKNNGGSKALALSGNTKLTNVNAPKNITAGDKYAQQQTWQVTVTVPNGGELQLLSASDKDLGVKIADGKVYYDNGGSYAAIPDVSVTAGSTYTIKREVNFTNATSDYAVYDASGKSLGSVKGKKLANISLPVTEITIAAKDVTGTAYIDNYKLYPAGLTTDFMVFDADTGFEVDAKASRNKDSAYRVSWLNATGKDMIAKVYNGSTLVGEFRMGVGQDGVNTGVVKANGKSVLLTVKTEVAPAQVTPPDGNDGGQTPAPTTPVDGTDPTNPVDGTNPTDGIDTTNPADKPNDDSTKPSDNKPGAAPEKKDRMSDVEIAVLVLVIILVLLGGAFALLWFVIKPKWLTEFFKKPAAQTGESTDAE